VFQRLGELGLVEVAQREEVDRADLGVRRARVAGLLLGLAQPFAGLGGVAA